MKRRIWTILTGAAGVVLLFSLLWFLPLSEGKETRTDYGQEQHFRSVADTNRNRIYEWKTEIHVGQDPGLDVFVPRLKFRMDWDAREDSADATVWLEIQHVVNGRQVYKTSGGFTDTQDADWGIGDSLPEPFNYDRVDQTPWRRGPNTVQTLAWVNQTVREPGSGSFQLSMGPPVLHRYSADSDHDGVPDARQPVRFMHSGFLSLVASGAWVGLVVLFEKTRRRRSNRP